MRLEKRHYVMQLPHVSLMAESTASDSTVISKLIKILNESPRFHISQNHRITESQNGRGWKGPLWVISSNPPAEAGSPTAGCTGPRPGAF